tara:strand:+ start:466 stop:573 length:108 start_codon:yes stop_codon:yes gene_type:complete
MVGAGSGNLTGDGFAGLGFENNGKMPDIGNIIGKL